MTGPNGNPLGGGPDLKAAQSETDQERTRRAGMTALEAGMKAQQKGLVKGFVVTLNGKPCIETFTQTYKKCVQRANTLLDMTGLHPSHASIHEATMAVGPERDPELEDR